MLILIAESKTMTSCDTLVSQESFYKHEPRFEKFADQIIGSLSDLVVNSLATRVGISIPLARKFRQMIYEFQDKGVGERAINAYTGVVFKSLDFMTLDRDAQEKCFRDVKIVSSLYGLLNADDYIKPYRTEFKSKISPEGNSLNIFYRPLNTGAICTFLKNNSITEVLNLLPGDAEKSIDCKAISEYAKVYKADFKQIRGTEYRTPDAGKLKRLRGELLRTIMTEQFESVDQLRYIETTNIMAVPNVEKNDIITFITD